ncbi:hypothetical protein RIF29_08859 [Crotalaria pallida]|uniref:Uncharacterized protein n=1 Tax=Crotalaria pallida TaxID=3830 RepID=A0AAN9IHK3_CROPI
MIVFCWIGVNPGNLIRTWTRYASLRSSRDSLLQMLAQLLWVFVVLTTERKEESDNYSSINSDKSHDEDINSNSQSNVSDICDFGNHRSRFTNMLFSSRHKSKKPVAQCTMEPPKQILSRFSSNFNLADGNISKQQSQSSSSCLSFDYWGQVDARNPKLLFEALSKEVNWQDEALHVIVKTSSFQPNKWGPWSKSTWGHMDEFCGT